MSDKDRAANVTDRRSVLAAGAAACFAQLIVPPGALADGDELPTKGDRLGC